MTQPPAGWYSNPQAPSQIRWWDGEQWTEHVQGIEARSPGAEIVPIAAFTRPAPVRFSPYIHTTERFPAAKGFAEHQLEGVPLMTVYPAVVPAIIGGFFLLVGWLGASYEFYVVLRWAVTAMAIWMCTIASGQKRTLWVVVFTGTALLFNPIIPLVMKREFWVLPDMIGLVLFAMAGRKLRASRPATHNDKRTF